MVGATSSPVSALGPCIYFSRLTFSSPTPRKTGANANRSEWVLSDSGPPLPMPLPMCLFVRKGAQEKKEDLGLPVACQTSRQWGKRVHPEGERERERGRLKAAGIIDSLGRLKIEILGFEDYANKKRERGTLRRKLENLLRQLEWCHKLQDPRYHCPGSAPWSSPSSFSRKKLAKGAVNTAATSRASSFGISEISGSALAPVASSNECSNATQGRTTNSVLARFAGNSQRCSTLNGAGNDLSISAKPISSHASRRAVWNGVSSSVSARPSRSKSKSILIRPIRQEWGQTMLSNVQGSSPFSPGYQR